METSTISGRPDATLPLTGNERVVMDQGTETVDAPVSAIVALAAGNTDLDYDPVTRQIKSSTGTDATLPLAGPVNPGLMTAAQQARLDELAASDSPSFAGLTITGPNAVVIPHIHGDVAGTLYFHVKNVSGGPLTKGTPVSVVGAVGDTTTLEVEATNPSVVGVTQAHGLLYADLADNASGHAVLLGELQEIDTSAYAPSTVQWVGASGGRTGTRPASGAQQVATVGRQHATTGTLLVAIQGVEPTPAQIGADPAGTASSAMTAHLAAADPHTQYTTPLEAAAAAPVQSVAGKAGAVTLVPSDVGAQPVDSDLTAIAALTTTTFGRGLLTTADAAAARTVIGAGTSNLVVGSTTPANLAATAAPGTSGQAARADHAHAMPPGTGVPTGALIAGGGLSTLSAFAGAAGRVYYSKIYIDSALAPSQILCRTSTTYVGASVVQLGIYTNQNNRPKDRIYTSGDIAIDVPSATASANYGASVTGLSMTPGWYWLALCLATFSGTPSFMGSGTGNINGVGFPFFTEYTSTMAVASHLLGVSTSLPDVAVSTTTNVGFPAVFLVF